MTQPVFHCAFLIPHATVNENRVRNIKPKFLFTTRDSFNMPTMTNTWLAIMRSELTAYSAFITSP